jgi:dTDP-glucose 4,6-dehydratase
MRNVLVTGGAGFIGSNFVRYLLRAEPDVQVANLDALTYAGSLENLADLPDPTRHAFVHGDICDGVLVESLLRERAIDTIVHFAAESHVDRSIVGPAPFVQTNVVGTFRLLEAARQVWLTEGRQPEEPIRFHHISTDEVFGSLGPDDPAARETTPYSPNSPYAASKAAGDLLAAAYARTYGLSVTISNCSNNYGPYQFPEKLIPMLILNGLERKPLPIYGDGLQVRDWLHVEDHCRAIHRILKDGRPGSSYNVAAGNQPTNLEVARLICAILDELDPGGSHASLIEMVADRPGHDRRYALDFTRVRTELGWQPRIDLPAGLRETVLWYLGQLDWVGRIRARRDYQDWLRGNYGERGMAS